jgi:hypothetical protein
VSFDARMTRAICSPSLNIPTFPRGCRSGYFCNNTRISCDINSDGEYSRDYKD